MRVYGKMLGSEKKCRLTAKVLRESHEISCRSELLYVEMTVVPLLFLMIDQNFGWFRSLQTPFFRSLGAQ